MHPVYSQMSCIDPQEDPDAWTYPCRCGGEYIVEYQDLASETQIFPCTGCTLRCRVVYFEQP
jgi:diphthamide biosynthesis protein 4